MNDAVLSDLFRALNLAVVERQPNHTFFLLTPPPTWLSGAFDAAQAGGQNTLGGAFPFLDDFLHQAAGAWDAGPHASIVSGPFAATVDGDELLLRATALTVSGRTLLVLERLVGAADTRPMLQKARQHVLEGEQLTKQVGKIHAPAAAIAEAAGHLDETPLTAIQRAIVNRLLESSARLNAAVADLPAPPPAHRHSN